MFSAPSSWKNYQVTKEDEEQDRAEAEAGANKSPLCKDCRLIPEDPAEVFEEKRMRSALQKLAVRTCVTTHARACLTFRFGFRPGFATDLLSMRFSEIFTSLLCLYLSS